MRTIQSLKVVFYMAKPPSTEDKLLSAHNVTKCQEWIKFVPSLLFKFLPMERYSLEDINAMEQPEFTSVLGDVFEHTPAIAHQSWQQRPFASVESLHQAMVAVMTALPVADQLQLIQAHPDLGSRVKMTPSSVKEQASAGLNQLSEEDYSEFQRLNQQYRERFQFPFIVAVKGLTKQHILQSFRQRLTHDVKTERQTALGEIAKIAWIRLRERVED